MRKGTLSCYLFQPTGNFFAHNVACIIKQLGNQGVDMLNRFCPRIGKPKQSPSRRIPPQQPIWLGKDTNYSPTPKTTIHVAKLKSVLSKEFGRFGQESETCGWFAWLGPGEDDAPTLMHPMRGPRSGIEGHFPSLTVPSSVFFPAWKDLVNAGRSYFGVSIYSPVVSHANGGSETMQLFCWRNAKHLFWEFAS